MFREFRKNPAVGTAKRTKVLLAVLAALVVFSALPPITSPARAQGLPEGITEVGPVNPETGYPYWLADANGVRLDLCLDPQDQMCLQPFESPNPTGPVSFPENFPGESFWWAGGAEMETATVGGRAGDAQLGLAMEAAFLGEEAKAGEQMSFGRIRIRVDNLVAGEEYTVTHPYGTETFIAEDNGRTDDRQAGEINHTEDLGCAGGALAPCDYDELVNGKNRVGPFLTWDQGAPEGYVGDPNVPHAVTGSPTGDNVFRIEGPDVGGPGVDSIEQNLFSISGKLATPQATATVQGDAENAYNAPQDVQLVSSDPEEAQVYYTTDPNVADEDIQSAGSLYNGETINIAEDSELRFQAVKGDQESEVYSEQYLINLDAPHVAATPEPWATSVLPSYQTFEEPQDVTLQANTLQTDGTDAPADATIYYTTDGSTPTMDSAVYEEPINVARSQTIKAFAVDAEDDQSRVESFQYKVASLAEVGPNNEYGYPEWLADANGVRLDLCLDPQDQMCLQPFESPNPDQPVSFPDNFPGESFWWAGGAEMPTGGGGEAQLTMASEAAFVTENAAAGDQIGFGRIRIRIDDLVIGEEYTVTHPYGTDTYIAEDNGRTGNRQAGEINVTEDIGCMMPSAANGCNFEEMRYSRVGPFLKWDEGAPNGYVGDPGIDHRVTGSPILDENGEPQNYFRVEGPDVGGAGVDEIETDLFSVSGKIAGLNASPSVEGGAFNEGQQVTLTAEDPNASIVFTTDGTDPEVTFGDPGANTGGLALLNLFAALDSGSNEMTVTNGTEYTEPIDITEDTELRYIVVNDSNVSKVYSEKYTIGEAPEPPAPAAPTAVELNAGRTVLTFGQKTVLSGELSSDGDAVAGERVTLLHKPAGDEKFTKLPGQSEAGVLVRDDGTFRLGGVKPEKNTVYRATFAGNEELEKSSSAAQRVNVKTKVTNATATKQMKVNQNRVITGLVKPDHTGKVKVQIKKGAKVVATRNVKLDDSRYRMVYKPKAPGNYAVRAIMPKHDDHLQGASPIKKFKVTR